MEIEALLPDRCAGEHEGPERAVERGPDGILADVLAVVCADVAESQREHGANADSVAFDGCTRCSPLGPEELGVDTGTRGVHDLGEPPRALGGGLVGAGVLGPRVTAGRAASRPTHRAAEAGALQFAMRAPPCRTRPLCRNSTRPTSCRSTSRVPQQASTLVVPIGLHIHIRCFGWLIGQRPSSRRSSASPGVDVSAQAERRVPGDGRSGAGTVDSAIVALLFQ